MSYQIEGVLTKKFDTVKVSEKFQKRQFVIEVAGDFTQTISFEMTNKRCSQLDKYEVGEIISVYFGIRGREWTNPQGVKRYFNTLGAYKITEPLEMARPKKNADDYPEDDLPF